MSVSRPAVISSLTCGHTVSDRPYVPASPGIQERPPEIQMEATASRILREAKATSPFATFGDCPMGSAALRPGHAHFR